MFCEPVLMARPFNIVHVIPGLETGGAEMMLVKLLGGTNRARWRPRVLSLRDRGTLGKRVEDLGVPLRTLGIQGGMPGPRAVLALRRDLRAFEPTVLQGWMYHGNLAALAGRVLMASRVPVLWCVRSTVFDFASEKRLTAGVVRLGALVSRHVTRIIYNSHTSAKQHAELGFAATRAMVIPNGFDTEVFLPSESARAAFRRRLNVTEDVILVGRVARYHPMKDYPGFLKAAAILSAHHANVRFVLAGTGVDANNPELVGQVRSLGLGDRVHLLGEIPEIPELLSALDIACSSSAYGESFPNVLGEAMACGVPCVTTDLGDSAWVLGTAGQIVPPLDPAALAAACGKLVDLGTEGRNRLGAIGRSRVVHEFSLERIVSQYEDLYEELLARGAPR